MRMVMERGCPEDHQIHLLTARLDALEERLGRAEGELAKLRAELRSKAPGTVSAPA